MFQTIEFPAGGREINAKATFLRYHEGDANGLDTTIRVRADGNDLGTFGPGDSIELNEPATRWTIAPLSGSCAGSIRLGMGRVSSSSISGVVEVVDGGRSRSLSRTAFMAPCAANTVAGQFAHCQIWMPAASTSRVIAKALKVSSSVAGGVHLRSHNAALATLYGGLLPKLINGGGLISTAEMRQANSAAMLGNGMGVIQIAASSSVSWEFVEPIVINPGFGLLIVHSVVNTDLVATVEGYVESI